MAWIPLDLNVTLFAEEIVVYHDGDEEPENVTSLADLFDGYENDIRGGFGYEEAEIYIMTTIKALDAGKAQLLAALAEMKTKEI
jgi:hypothetical protein